MKLNMNIKPWELRIMFSPLNQATRIGEACRSMREKRNTYKLLVGKPQEKNHFESLGADRRKILRWKYEGRGWSGLSWLRIEMSDGLL
jgi:hypothetical protein